MTEPNSSRNLTPQKHLEICASRYIKRMKPPPMSAEHRRGSQPFRPLATYFRFGHRLTYGFVSRLHSETCLSEIRWFKLRALNQSHLNDGFYGTSTFTLTYTLCFVKYIYSTITKNKRPTYVGRLF